MFDITALITFLLGAVLGAVVKWFYDSQKNPTTTSTQTWVLSSMVEAVCLVAEKMFMGSGRGAEKFEFAFKYIEGEAEKLGITFNSGQVSTMIKDFVKEMNETGGWDAKS